MLSGEQFAQSYRVSFRARGPIRGTKMVQCRTHVKRVFWFARRDNREGAKDAKGDGRTRSAVRRASSPALDRAWCTCREYAEGDWYARS